ncbi:hypothetical protein [Myxococcus faecalis]|uniref:hypothetical protein n=1 Tax=Myxococcus faecalis TaxID=3115646 RepID=UPI003CF7634C
MEPIRTRTTPLLPLLREPADGLSRATKATPRPPRLDNFIEAFPARASSTSALVPTGTALPMASSLKPGATPSAKAPSEDGPKEKGFFARVGAAIGSAINRAADAVGGLVTGAVEATVGTLRNTVESVGTVFRGLGNIFTGRFREGFTQLGTGLVMGLQTPLDATLILGGRAISAVQTLLGLEPVRRSLTDDEVSALRTVYGDSIDYSRISIKEGSAGLFSLSGRAFTHGDTIYIPKKDLPLQLDLLVHEVGHVWQHQNGGTDYMSEALVAQFFGDGYNVLKALREGKAWEDMNPEQQAELLELGFKSGHLADASIPFILEGEDYTAQLDAALREVRAGRGAP